MDPANRSPIAEDIWQAPPTPLAYREEIKIQHGLMRANIKCLETYIKDPKTQGAAIAVVRQLRARAVNELKDLADRKVTLLELHTRNTELSRQIDRHVDEMVNARECFDSTQLGVVQRIQAQIDRLQQRTEAYTNF